MKYVILRTPGKNGREFPIIFPNDLSHDQVAHAVIPGCPELYRAKVVSAGEIPSFSLGGPCHGRSVTLNLKSREERDTAMIRMRDYNAGMQL